MILKKYTITAILVFVLSLLSSQSVTAMAPKIKREVSPLEKVYNYAQLTGASFKHCINTHPYIALLGCCIQSGLIGILSALPYKKITKIGTTEWKQSIIPLTLTIAGLSITGGFVYGLNREEVPCALLIAVMENRINDVRWYLGHGVNPNITDLKQRSLLYFATEQNHIEIARLLLEHGADPNTKEYRGAAPIHRAIEFGHLEIAELLKKYKADMNLIRDDFGYAPIHIALQEDRFRTLQWLINNGADIHLPTRANRESIEIALSVNNMPAFQYLLQRGANVMTRNRFQEPLLQIACENNNLYAAMYLLVYNALIDAQDPSGNTALMTACKNGFKEMVKLLLSHSANKAIANKNGHTAIHFAQDQEIQELLQSQKRPETPEAIWTIMLERAGYNKNIFKKIHNREINSCLYK